MEVPRTQGPSVSCIAASQVPGTDEMPETARTVTSIEKAWAVKGRLWERPPMFKNEKDIRDLFGFSSSTETYVCWTPFPSGSSQSTEGNTPEVLSYSEVTL